MCLFFLLLFFTDACGRDRSTANVCVYGQQICRERNNPKENIKLCAHQVSVWSTFLQIFCWSSCFCESTLPGTFSRSKHSTFLFSCSPCLSWKISYKETWHFCCQEDEMFSEIKALHPWSIPVHFCKGKKSVQKATRIRVEGKGKLAHLGRRKVNKNVVKWLGPAEDLH